MTRDAYYKKKKRRHKRYAEEAVVLRVVDEIREDEPRVGTRKLHDRLKKFRFKIGRDKLFNLLRSKRKLVKPKKSFKKTTNSNHGYAVAKNEVKELESIEPRQVLVSDITYLRLAREKFCYLFLVTDAGSRKILGYHVSKDLSHYSGLLALDMASKELRDTQGIIHHSDRGCQYCCHEYLRYLRELGMIPSMTDENHCYQNAIAERINGILKDEFNLDAVFESVVEAKRAVVKSVHVYNTKRTHWSLELRTPEEVYELAA